MTIDVDAGCALCGETGATRLFEKRGWTFVRCPRCRLVSIRPLPTEAALLAHHEQSYATGGYAVYAAAESIRSAIAAHRLAVVRRLAPAGPWLDVGCATGALLAAARDAGIDAEGLEMSRPAIEHARARGLRVHEGVVERFAPERRYAAVTAFDVVEHLRDPLGFVRRVGAWLLPGAVLVLTVPNIESVTARLMGRYWYFYAPPDHLHYFTPATITRLLTDAGLSGVTVARASKPLTLEYAAQSLEQFNPRLGRLARATVALAPARLRRHLWPIPIGELTVTARPTSR
jgi:SAM-dependent methyltransferase